MMRRILTTACALVALGLLYACGSDRSLAPVAHSWRGAAGFLNSDRSDPDWATIVTLRRSAYLANDISQSAVIGPDGGEIDIDDAGTRIVFPAGALSRRTRITMTVKAGWNVAYEFGPHGITFGAPVIVQQDLSYTVAKSAKAAAKVQAGYYQRSLDTAFLDPLRSVARVSELRQVTLDRTLNSLVANFYIYHFSGYILSSGFTGGGGDAGDSASMPQ
jgi:hypothetical protein